jgi:Tol biopolymer transport system component
MEEIVKVIAILFLSVLLPANLFYVQESFKPLKGPYMGRAAGDSPEIFLPGKISTGRDEGCSLFYPGARSFLWRSSEDGISQLLLLEDKDGRWQPPRQIRLFEDNSLVFDFTLGPRGQWIYFTSDKEVSGEGTRANIWRVKLEAGQLYAPEILGPEVNTNWNDSYPSVTRDGQIYFFRRNPEDLTDCDLYVAPSKNGELQKAVRLESPVNSDSLEYDPFVSPAGDYLIFSSRRSGGQGQGDLYISFAQEDNRWGVPVNLGPEINSSAEENRPYITLDGRYFFFTSTRNREPMLPPGTPPASSMPGSGSRDIYWMKADFIEKLR